jgi:micrococcal nuclease
MRPISDQHAARRRAVRLELGWGGCAALLLLLAGAPAGSSPQTRAQAAAERDVPLRDPASLERVWLVRVLDGDTLDVQRAGKVDRVRLAGVDTEERLHATSEAIAGAPQTVFGEETALWLARLLPAQGQLFLLRAPGGERRDAHGRLLAHLALPDGRDLNVLLVRLGRSPYFQRYGASEVDHAGLEGAQRAARAEQLGIWNPRTNRPRESEAPRAARDYRALLAWWEARAAAVRAFRSERDGGARAVYEAALPEDLERAARERGPSRVFGAVEGTLELSSDALLVFIETAPSAPALRLFVPAARRREFAPLELGLRATPARQSYLWIEGAVRPRGGHWSIEVESPACVRPAGPEPGGE